ncbi:MAG: hypothetical protein ACTHQ3_01325 [Motilibacteraceae bacterium]
MIAVLDDEAMNRTWSRQLSNYPTHGKPGITYFLGRRPDGFVDCLLWRDEAGALRGILNHYPNDFPPFEKAGNVNLWVCPRRQRAGIGTALLQEGDLRWRFNFDQQMYTRGGLALVRKHLSSVWRR